MTEEPVPVLLEPRDREVHAVIVVETGVDQMRRGGSVGRVAAGLIRGEGVLIRTAVLTRNSICAPGEEPE